MASGGWDIDVIVHGYPGKSVCHGALGWSTIALLRGHGRVVLVDAGSFGMRRLLIDGLAARGLAPADVTDLLLTHAHWDHSVNWTLVSQARIHIGRVELDWALGEPWGETPVPELYVRELDKWPTVSRVDDGAEVLPGITAHIAPGHTPGCLVFCVDGGQSDTIFTGDAAKNRAELVSGETDMTYDASVSRETIARVWEIWRRKAGSVVVPGHDLPMVQDGGVTRYLGTRDAAITSWFGDAIDQTTRFSLCLGGAA
jgi:glyoxylase-like metal-dependent hydrolase (beta-lactamase superfamily II)